MGLAASHHGSEDVQQGATRLPRTTSWRGDLRGERRRPPYGHSVGSRSIWLDPCQSPALVMRGGKGRTLRQLLGMDERLGRCEAPTREATTECIIARLQNNVECCRL